MNAYGGFKGHAFSPFQHSFRSLLIFITILLLLGATSLTAHATTIHVPPGGSLQAAIDAANFGDTIVLEAGATYVVPGLELPFLLKNKGTGTNTDADYITIRTSTLDRLPPDGERVTAAHAPAMPKLVTNVASPVLEAEALAHHYRFVGIEFTLAPNAPLVQRLIDIGSRRDVYLGVGNLPHDIVFDRCYVHGLEDGTDSIFVSAKDGFAINAVNITVKNSRLAGFRGYFRDMSGVADSHAILMNVGPGPVNITNNYIEAWFTEIFLGGSDPDSPNNATVAAGATTTRATFSNTANLAVGDLVAFDCGNASPRWQVAKVTGVSGGVVSYVGWAGSSGSSGNALRVAPPAGARARWNGYLPQNVSMTRNQFVKNAAVMLEILRLSGGRGKGHIEIKACESCTLDGNTFEGFHIGLTLTPRNQNGSAPWSRLNNLAIRNNWWKYTPYGEGTAWAIQLEDNERTSVPTENLIVENNLIESGSAPFAQITAGRNVVFRHNTVIGTADPGPYGSNSMLYSFGPPTENMQFVDNLTYSREYGSVCLMPSGGCWPDKTQRGNVVIDNRSAASKLNDGTLDPRFPGDFIAPSLGAVGFVNPAASNYRLAAASPYKGRATDGTDPGVNMDALLAAIGGTGALPAPAPTPQPQPQPTPRAVAEFVRIDPTTQGNWKGVYGTNGYAIVNDAVNYSSRVRLAADGNLYTWAASTSDSRAIQRAAGSDRLAATWYSEGTFTIDLDLSGELPQRVALYCLDWDSKARAQTIEVRDAASGALLDSRSVQSFRDGQYVVWNVAGHVRISVKRGAGPNAVVSGLFLNPVATSSLTSPALITAARRQAASLAESSSVSESQLWSLAANIEGAHIAFAREASNFVSADQIELSLQIALYFARAASALASAQESLIPVQNRLQVASARLQHVETLMGTGSGGSLITTGGASGAPVIGLADTRSSATFAPAVSPASLGMILGDSTQSPLAAQEVFATPDAAGAFPYHLGGASVTVGGRAAVLLSVSPSRVMFCVPSGLAPGEAEVLVTSEQGYVSRGTVNVSAVAPGIFTTGGNGTGDALAMNAATYLSGAFDVLTSIFGGTSNTRLMLFTTGIGSVANTDLSNDLPPLGSVRLVNLAESIAVEARTGDGRVFHLPVEFAGPQGRTPGLNQVTVRLLPELRGAGRIDLTIMAGGQTSNTASVTVR